MLPAPLPAEVSVLHDADRVAAARRLLVEVATAAAFDRLSGLAARLLGTRYAGVVLVTSDQTLVGGHGLPPGAVGAAASWTDAFSALTVRRGAPLAVPDASADPALATLPAVASGAIRGYLGVPLLAGSGHVVGVLAGYDPAPRHWSAEETALLEQLAASVVAELELSAARSAVSASLARLDVALEASAVGIWEQDLRTHAVHWDERCAAIFGFEGAVDIASAEQVIAERVHPEDRETVTRAMRAALAGSGEYLVEARVVRVDGTVRWVVSRGRVLTDAAGEPVRVLGTAVDVTAAREEAERRIAAVQLAAATAEVAAELANATRICELTEIALRGAAVLGAEAIGLAVFDPLDGKLYLHLTRHVVEEVASRADVRLPPGGVQTPLDDTLPIQYVARHGQPVVFPDAAAAEARFPRLGGINALLGLRALATLPLRVEGRLLGSFTAVWTTDRVFSDTDVELLEALTAQIALSVSRLHAGAERARAVAAMAEANRRLQLLAEAGRILSGTLDVSRQIDQLVDLVVPELGDWCWLVVTDEQGRLHEMASAHRDPARNAELEQYVRRMVAGMSEDAAARVVTRTGRPLLLPRIDRTLIERALPEPDTQAALTRLGIASGITVPLVARGQTLGALGLFTSAERGPHTPAEVETAEEVGRRAGLALHHARLYAQQRTLADALQHSLLTDPPQPAGGEIVVRYVPAAAGVQIGGDWYDAFPAPDGGTVLAIGDVVGHDSGAAAAMGQLRGLLRGVGYAGGADPAGVLTQLDRTMRGLGLDTMATVLVAHLAPAGGSPDGVQLRWSSAGHPAPVLVEADGGVTLLQPDPSDLLLGVDPDAARIDRTALLPAGSTLLLYTDGLVERRDRDLDAGTAELLAVLGEYAGLPLTELCDRVLQRMFLPDAADDVALLALRLAAPG